MNQSEPLHESVAKNSNTTGHLSTSVIDPSVIELFSQVQALQ